MTTRRSTLIATALITLAVLAIYVPGLHNELIFDDARLTDGTIFNHYGNPFKLQPRLLSYGTFVWLQPLIGDNWVGQRVFNIVLHGAVSFSIALLLKELFASLPSSQEFRVRSFNDHFAILAAVGLFAIHPMAVYGVGYLVQRSIVMAALFSVLACYCYARALRRRQPIWAVYSLISYFLALLSKEQSVLVVALTLPIYIFICKPSWRRVVLLMSLVSISLLGIAYILTLRYGSIFGATTFDETSKAYLKQLEQLRPGVSSIAYPLSVLNQSLLFFNYGLLWVFPNTHWMSIDLRPAFPLTLTSMPQILGACFFLSISALSFLIILKRRDRIGLAATFLLSAIILFSTEFATTWLQDPFFLYRSYLWSFPMVGLFALGLSNFPAKIILALSFTLTMALIPLSWERVQSIRDENTAWSDAATKVDLDGPTNAVGRWRPFMNRGAYYLEHEVLESALDDFNLAIKLDEPLGSAQQNRGVALQLLNRDKEALQAFEAAEQLGFKEGALYYHRAISLSRLSRFQEAVQAYTHALSKPQAEKTRLQILLERGEIAIPAGEYTVAIEDFTNLLKVKPEEVRYLVGLGLAQVGNQQIGDALNLFTQALQHRNSAPILYGRAIAYRAKGNQLAAILDLDHAIQLEPDNLIYRHARQEVIGLTLSSNGSKALPQRTITP